VVKTFWQSVDTKFATNLPSKYRDFSKLTKCILSSANKYILVILMQQKSRYSCGVWTYLRMFLNSKFHHFYVKCWILFKQMLDGNLHLTVPSFNRLSQTEFTTFSILPFWTFFRESYFLYFAKLKALLASNMDIVNEKQLRHITFYKRT
jgi:hypothetical protein